MTDETELELLAAMVPDPLPQRKRRSAAERKEAAKESRRLWVVRNRDKVKKQQRAWARRNADKLRPKLTIARRELRQRNPEKAREASRKNNTRMKMKRWSAVAAKYEQAWLSLAR